MKRLLLAPLLISFLLASCSNNKKYNSYRQTSEACKAWTYKGGNFTLINPKFEVNETYLRERSWSNRKVGDIFKEERIYIPLRWCEEEKETRQILGLVNNVRLKNKEIPLMRRSFLTDSSLIDRWQKGDGTKVIANFYY